ncbi:DUF4440 domain-containing protein [Bradyrhizobium sp. Gha]|uniref:YybH family protein n=1 Tax=Bradyrhizobium sp. Gha TaxID=1855318 RepID=UPI001FCD55E9|nr:DUF4440 domain-containing protein [Bradyrhizobium sp. Gha]
MLSGHTPAISRLNPLRSFVNGADGNSPELLLHLGGSGMRHPTHPPSRQTTALHPLEMIMRNLAAAMTIVISLSAPALAQKAEIDANNAKWLELFNKGDFSGIASLYSADAIALPPGSSMVQGRTAIEAMWKSMAEQVTDPKLTTLDVKPLGSSAAREIGTFILKTKGASPQEVTGKYVVVWEKVGEDWKLTTDIWNDGK